MLVSTITKCQMHCITYKTIIRQVEQFFIAASLLEYISDTENVEWRLRFEPEDEENI